MLIFASSEESLNKIKNMNLEQSIFKDRGIKVEYMILKQNVIENPSTFETTFEQEIIFPGNVAFEWNNETKLYDKKHVRKEKSEGETLVVKAKNSTSNKNLVQINSSIPKPLSAWGSYDNLKISNILNTKEQEQPVKTLSNSFSQPVFKDENFKDENGKMPKINKNRIFNIALPSK